jgi:hypothetical protein
MHFSLEGQSRGDGCGESGLIARSVCKQYMYRTDILHGLKDVVNLQLL